MKKRNVFFLLYVQGKLPKLLYTNFRNHVTKQICAARKKYYEDLFESVKHDARQSWRIINGFHRSNSSKNHTSIAKLIYNDRILGSNIEMAETLNDYFVNV